MNRNEIKSLVGMVMTGIFNVEHVDDNVLNKVYDKVIEYFKDGNISDTDLDKFGYLMVGKSTILKCIYDILKE